jgi:SNF family Na+-dependent transporter
LEGAIAVFVDMKLVDWPRWAVTSFIVLVLFFMSTIFCFGWGMYMQNFLDQFLANWSLLIIGFFECVAIAWVYGLAK